MNKILVTLAVLFGVASAQAGILIEPYLGYETGSFKPDYITTPIDIPEYTDTASGAGMGLRLGYKFMIPWVALDYTTVSGKAKTGVPGGTDYDFNQTGIGGVVGADIPFVRGWVGYGFSNDYLAKATSTSSEMKFRGTYTKVGVGFKFIPFISLNAEYKINTYNKVETGGVSVDRSTLLSSLNHNSLMISVSAPFNL